MQVTDRKVLRGFAVAAAAVVVVLSGCGGGGGGGGAAKTTQVAVKINADEITVQQVNEQLARIPAGITPDKLEPATRQVLVNLVNQQLLVQQALERKLDRDPQILGALEAARLNILAQAYIQRVIAPQAKPTEQEIRNYYAENPALFSDRKVYRLQELSIEANAEQEKSIETAAAGMKSLKKLAEYLRDKKILFAADSGVRTAEQLPLAQLKQVAQLKSGDLLVFPTAEGRASAIEILASEPQPVDDKKATPVIEQFLTNRKQQDLARSELSRLRSGAKLEYVGDFAKYSGDPAGATAVAGTTATPAATPAANAQDKGIAALK
jgi:EpsD family peptidyl-prolyl cis-trans isomerase